MPAKTLMVQGTASSVGKSVMVSALCRIFRQDGLNVAPFKSQNMSLNSYVTREGHEIGRAQVVQAEAAGVEPTVEMNPVLLKPEADNRSQVILRGKPLTSLPAKEYYALKDRLWSVITESLATLTAAYDVVVIEGAGSPAEVNLRDMDLVNMRVALHCDSPVLLVGDIDRGGVFASLVGTLELLEPEERALVQGIVINRFRGDRSLLEPGLEWLEQRTGVPVAGVVPYYHDIHIAEEDSVFLERRRRMKEQDGYVLDIAVIGLPHISNFDDFDPFERDEGVRLRYVESDDPLGEPDLIILPGTKSTASDLRQLRTVGLADEVVARARSGTPVIGICGGLQMLGERILDPERIESHDSEIQGLGLLPVETTFSASKSTHQVRGRVVRAEGLLLKASGLTISGYEIHMGQTTGTEEEPPFLLEEQSGRACHRPDGLMAPGGNVFGTYVHGLFHNDALRRAILEELAERKEAALPSAGIPFSKDDQYDRLADLVRNSLDMDLVYRALG